jgi:chromosomal replication initiation ATPase DnaA
MLFEEPSVRLYNPEFIRQARENNRRREEERRAAAAKAIEESRLEQERKLAERRVEAAAKNLAEAEAKYEALVVRRRHRHTFREIELRACRLFNAKPSEIHSRRRHSEIVFVRQFVMYWARRLTPLSLPQIGRLLGGRDHTTVLHGCERYVSKRAAQGRTLRPAR